MEQFLFRKQLGFQASSKVSSSRKFDKNEGSAKSKATLAYLQSEPKPKLFLFCSLEFVGTHCSS